MHSGQEMSVDLVVYMIPISAGPIGAKQTALSLGRPVATAASPVPQSHPGIRLMMSRIVTWLQAVENRTSMAIFWLFYS